jgi:hypothetical protein
VIRSAQTPDRSSWANAGLLKVKESRIKMNLRTKITITEASREPAGLFVSAM